VRVKVPPRPFFRFQSLVAGSFAQIVDLGGNTFQREVLNLLDNWHDQTTFT
jgi:hypothetical protein